MRWWSDAAENLGAPVSMSFYTYMQYMQRVLCGRDIFSGLGSVAAAAVHCVNYVLLRSTKFSVANMSQRLSQPGCSAKGRGATYFTCARARCHYPNTASCSCSHCARALATRGLAPKVVVSKRLSAAAAAEYIHSITYIVYRAVNVGRAVGSG